MRVDILCPKCLQMFHVEREENGRILLKISGRVHDCGARLKIDFVSSSSPIVEEMPNPPDRLMRLANQMGGSNGKTNVG